MRGNNRRKGVQESIPGMDPRSADSHSKPSSTHDEGVVERSEDVRDAEDVLSLRHLGAEGNPLLHLVLLLLVRLAVDSTDSFRRTPSHHAPKLRNSDTLCDRKEVRVCEFVQKMP